MVVRSRVLFAFSALWIVPACSGSEFTSGGEADASFDGAAGSSGTGGSKADGSADAKEGGADGSEAGAGKDGGCGVIDF